MGAKTATHFGMAQVYRELNMYVWWTSASRWGSERTAAVCKTLTFYRLDSLCVVFLKPPCSCLSSPCSRRQSRMAFSGRDVFEQAVSAKLFNFFTPTVFVHPSQFAIWLKWKYEWWTIIIFFFLQFFFPFLSVGYLSDCWNRETRTWFAQLHIILKKDFVFAIIYQNVVTCFTSETNFLSRWHHQALLFFISFPTTTKHVFILTLLYCLSWQTLAF